MTTITNPTISVVVPCYNYGRFLAEALDSLLNQTLLPNEIIIADDYSTDNTPLVCQQYCQQYPQLIKCFRNRSNLGIVKNFNKAVAQTKGDYICFLGADNRFKNTFLKKTPAVLNSSPKIGVVYTDFELFGPNAKHIYSTFNLSFRGKINKKDNTFLINFPDFNHVSQKMLLSNNFIHGSSLFRKEAFDQVGGYLDSRSVPEDHNLFFRIINHGWNAYHVPEPLLEYRQHSNSQANIVFQKKTINIADFSPDRLLDLLQKEEELKQFKESKFYLLWPLYSRIKKFLNLRVR